MKKNPAKQDSPPAAGRASDILPFRRSAILAERFYRMETKFYTIKKRNSRNCHAVFVKNPFRRRFAPKESRGERPVRLCDHSYFVTPAAQIAV